MANNSRVLTLTLAATTLLVLALSVPSSLRSAHDRGGVYVFTQAFFEDIPGRLIGPGWFRLIFQPLIAAILAFGPGGLMRRPGGPPT